MKWFLVITIIILFASNILFSQPDSLKQEHIWERPWPNSQYSIKLGAFAAINNTYLGMGANHEPYSNIDFENTLGMDKNTYSWLANANVRLGRRHRIDFSYYNIYRNSNMSLQDSLHFRDNTYFIGSDVSAYLNTNIFRLSYGYAFLSNENLELGALLGFHVLAFDIGMKMQGDNANIEISDDAKFTAPLPDLGFWGTYAFHNRWAISGELSYFAVKIDGIKGEILNAALALQYRITRFLEIDLGYTNFDVIINIDRTHLQGDFNWNYNGPYINLAYKFGK